MLILTLVQSHTYVDIVQSVSHIATNSRDICWRRTMKVVGTRVTFVRRNSTTVVTLSSIYFVVMII